MTEHEVLEHAVLACQSALTDYQAGLLDEDELRHELEGAGTVVGESGTWFLDVELGRWCRYAPVPAGRALDSGTVRRWRAGLRVLLEDAARTDGSNRREATGGRR